MRRRHVGRARMPLAGTSGSRQRGRAPAADCSRAPIPFGAGALDLKHPRDAAPGGAPGQPAGSKHDGSTTKHDIRSHSRTQRMSRTP
ncbi:hypothetical protein WM26_36185 [Burkholderia cepacia]|nr:hypothetical protein WM26_36185 [Burkholderia cepacia]